MHVVILGAGRTGSLLAKMLDDVDHDITVIDWSASAFDRLPDNFSGETIVGNGVDVDVLRAAGTPDADVFVAATSGDNRNIMASQIAQYVLHVPKIVCRIKDPNRAKIYSALGMHVDCRTTKGADRIIELLEPRSAVAAGS